MLMPDDKAADAEKISTPTEMTSRRQAIGVMGTTAATMVGATMSAQAQTPAATPLRLPVPPPALVPRADLVNVFEYEAQARLVRGAHPFEPHDEIRRSQLRMAGLVQAGLGAGCVAHCFAQTIWIWM